VPFIYKKRVPNLAQVLLANEELLIIGYRKNNLESFFVWYGRLESSPPMVVKQTSVLDC